MKVCMKDMGHCTNGAKCDVVEWVKRNTLRRMVKSL